MFLHPTFHLANVLCISSFAVRGNVFDLAVGIVIGTAFANVVESLVVDVITPPLGLLLGGVDFADLTIKMNNFVYKNQPPVVIRYGKFLQSVLSLLVTAFAIFLVIKGVNRLYRIATKQSQNVVSGSASDVPADSSEQIKILREIRDLLAHQWSNPSLKDPS